MPMPNTIDLLGLSGGDPSPGDAAGNQFWSSVLNNTGSFSQDLIDKFNEVIPGALGVVSKPGVDAGIIQDPFPTETSNTSPEENIIEQIIAEAGFSPSEYIKDHPGLSSEEYMQAFANESDEWAEKLIDYYTERESIDRANAYTAEREDTAYQRLVADLKAAGLNPAMMYGSSASTSSSGSAGTINAVEGASNRSFNKYSKIKQQMLSYMVYTLNKNLGYADVGFKGVQSIMSILPLFAALMA